jgi:hypothetical protein
MRLGAPYIGSTAKIRAKRGLRGIETSSLRLKRKLSEKPAYAPNG